MATVRAKKHQIHCEVSASFGQVIEPLKRDDVINWLNALPESAKIKFAGISSGHVYFTAAWTIPMHVAREGAEPPDSATDRLD